MQTRPPSPRIIIPDIQTYCSLIAQRVSIRNLLSMYSAIYSHYCCYILIHCAACTQVDHPSILHTHTRTLSLYRYSNRHYTSQIFIDQLDFQVSLPSCHDKLFASWKNQSEKVVCLMFSWRVTLKLKATTLPLPSSTFRAKLFHPASPPNPRRGKEREEREESVKSESDWDEHFYIL